MNTDAKSKTTARYDEDFKRQAVELLLKSGRRLKALTRELGMDPVVPQTAQSGCAPAISGELRRETRNLTTILASTETCGLARQVPDAYECGVHCLPKRHQGKIYLITVNAKHQTAHCTFNLPNAGPATRVNVLFENRQLSLTNGSFADEFKPYERHVYEAEQGDVSKESK